MRKADHPLFLERESYRRRRLMDAARVAPVITAFLFCFPLLWVGREDVPTTFAIIYLFSVWLILVVGAYFLSRRLRDMPSRTDRTRR
jgi:hypothetical protein